MLQRAGASGFTLIEVVVALVVLGLAFGLAAPSLIKPRLATDDDVQRVVDDARRVAVRRAEAVTLEFEADGRWRIEAGRSRDSLLLTGTVPWPHARAVRLHVSALGACALHAPAGSGPSLSLDPVRCRFRAPQD